MRKILSTVLVTLFALALAYTPARAYRSVAQCPSTVAASQAGAAGVDPVVDVNGNFCVASQSDPIETPVTASGTSVAGPLASALAGVALKTTYICGFSARSSATAAATGNLTVAGTISGTMNFSHFTTALTDIGFTEQNFYPCIPASAVNTAITVTVPANGGGGTISLSVWGFQK